jgi:hypothetical protein
MHAIHRMRNTGSAEMKVTDSFEQTEVEHCSRENTQACHTDHPVHWTGAGCRAPRTELRQVAELPGEN